MIVWIWSAVAPTPPKGYAPPDIVQPIANKDDVEDSKIFEALPPLHELHEKVPEKIESLDSGKISAEFSNFGATLNKVTIKGYDATLPITGMNAISQYVNVPFSLDKIGENTFQYVYENHDVRVVKRYTISQDDYIISASTEVHNLSDMSKLMNVDVESYTIEMSSLDKRKINISNNSARNKSLFEYVIKARSGIYRKARAHKFSMKEKKGAWEGVSWVGFRDRYFCALVKPEYEATGYSVVPLDEHRLKIITHSRDVTIPPQGTERFDSTIYVGPEEIAILKTYGFGFEKIKRYYRFALFDGIAKIIDSVMHGIYKIIPNWGVVIILISIIIYFSMYPLTLRGMLSMKKMQSLQPMIVKLKEKHKNNPQKMNKEMMELYKTHKVNPLGGCLPMLLQMPVFIGLYQVLWRSVSFKGSKFLWISDLSKPDRLFTFPFKLPLLGDEFNVLPVIMVFVMFFQQKLSGKNMVVTDPSQAAQQKIMTTIMPVFLGFIFYKFASGLTLYFTMFYLFSTFTQWKMSKRKKAD